MERTLTHRDLARLIARIFGLLVLLGVAVNLPSTIHLLVYQINFWETARAANFWPTAVLVGASILGPDAAYAAVGLICLWWSGRLVDRASQGSKDGDLPVASSELRTIELSLVAMIGLYFLAGGFAELCRWIFGQGVHYGLDGSATPVSSWTRVSLLEIPLIVQALMKLTIGALLVLGRGATVAALHQARHWVKKWRAWPYQPE